MCTVLEIVKNHIKLHGYDGLFNSEVGCACRNQDLFPCDGSYGCTDCRPGYLVLPDEEKLKDSDYFDGDVDWMICSRSDSTTAEARRLYGEQ